MSRGLPFAPEGLCPTCLAVGLRFFTHRPPDVIPAQGEPQPWLTTENILLSFRSMSEISKLLSYYSKESCLFISLIISLISKLKRRNWIHFWVFCKGEYNSTTSPYVSPGENATVQSTFSSFTCTPFKFYDIFRTRLLSFLTSSLYVDGTWNYSVFSF